MVKRSQKNLRNHKLNRETLSTSIKSADSYADELIKSLSEKRENRRAKQTWEWEQVRRKTAQLQTAA